MAGNRTSIIARRSLEAGGVLTSSLLGICLRTLLLLLCISGAFGGPASRRVAGRMLIASDVHFNPMADSGLVADLAAGDPSQWEKIFQRSSATRFSPYGKDSNWWLLQSGLDAMVRAEPHPALVLFTGDLLPHNFPEMYKSITNDADPQHYRTFVLKTVEFMSLEFRKRFPKTKILLTPGNNDEECGDYSIQANGPFLHDTAEEARELAMEGEQFSATWISLGSYRVQHPALPGLRIVSLNSVFWSELYRAASFSQGCGAVNSAAAGDLFEWLESQLVDAEKLHEKVWLMFHIPPGIDGWATTHHHPGNLATNQAPVTSCASSIVPMWVPEWSKRFDKLLQRYAGTVVASFAGHTHADDFRVLGTGDGKQQFVLIDPAISPIYYQNPSFRVVDFRDDGTLADQSTYYLTNLEDAGGKTAGHWKREYRFSQRWKVRQLDGASLAKIYGQVASMSAARELWLRLYLVSSAAQPIQAADVKTLTCAIGSPTQQTYESCYCSATVAPGQR